jgi:nucleotide-binding universal stress UspA family protein
MVIAGSQRAIKRIFLVVDLTQLKRYTTTLAVWLARRFRADVVIAHVEDVGDEARGNGDATLGSAALESRQQAMDELRRVKSQISGAGVKAKTIYYEGTPAYVELGRLAIQRRAELIVMELDDGEGSLTSKFMGRSRCPILVLGSQMERVGRHSIENVIYVMDYSSPSLTGAKYVLELARELTARIFIFRRSASDGDDSAKELLESLLNEPGENSNLVESTCVSTADDMVGELFDFAGKVQADLIVVSGRIGFNLGRDKDQEVPTRMVEQAGCPVMLLPWGDWSFAV